MNPGSLSERTPFIQFLFTLMIFLGCFIVFQLIALLTGFVFFGSDFVFSGDTKSLYSTPEGISFLKYVQSVLSIGMFVVASLISAWFLSPSWKDYLNLRPYREYGILLLAGLTIFLSLPVNNFLTYLNNLLELPEMFRGIQDYIVSQEKDTLELMEKFLDAEGILALLVNLFVVAVIPGIGEELLFRGVLQKIFVKWTRSVLLGILITSVIFAAFHFQFLSFLPRFVLSVILGYFYVWSGSIWVPVFAHFLNNATAVIFYHLYYNDKIGDALDKVGTPEYNPLTAVVSFTIMMILMFVIYKSAREKKPSQSPGWDDSQNSDG